MKKILFGIILIFLSLFAVWTYKMFFEHKINVPEIEYIPTIDFSDLDDINPIIEETVSAEALSVDVMDLIMTPNNEPLHEDTRPNPKTVL